ncbi:MAG TPA: response regulator [Roseomonas sp.]
MVSGIEGRRILVVEDEALIAMLVEESLHGGGAQVVGPALCVDEALRLINEASAQGAIDAAVLDVRLRDSTVLPVADRLAALGVPFVFTTGYYNVGTNVHASAPLLVKPFSPEDLIAALAGLVKAPRSARAGHLSLHIALA